MEPRDVATLFAFVLLSAAACVAIAIVVPTARRELARRAPIVVGAVALGATFGSLYYSEVAGFVPCDYCWYQRIAMYPIALIVPLGVALRDRSVLRYALLLAGIGFAVSAYHVQLQLFPDQSSTSCSLTSPCTEKWVEAFGFMTIPQMAGVSFAVIIAVSVVGLRSDRSGIVESPSHD